MRVQGTLTYSGIVIGPAPGEDGGAVDDEIACTYQAAMQGQQQLRLFAVGSRSPSRTEPRKGGGQRQWATRTARRHKASRVQATHQGQGISVQGTLVTDLCTVVGCGWDGCLICSRGRQDKLLSIARTFTSS